MLILIDSILKPMEIVFFSHSMNTHKPSDSTWSRFALSTRQTEPRGFASHVDHVNDGLSCCTTENIYLLYTVISVRYCG